MHGNVFEWCEDDYHKSYEKAPTKGNAWLSSHKNATKILRGGSWSGDPKFCRCAYRGDYDPDLRDYNVGLRMVRVVPRILS